MSAPSIRSSLLFRCGIGVGTLLCILAAVTYLLVRKSLYSEMDDAITQTAALLANQVELEDSNITFEWQEGLGTNRSLITQGLFQFWDETTGVTTRSPALHYRDLPRFFGIHGAPLLRSIQLPNGNRARALGLRIYPFVVPEEKKRMFRENRIIDPKTLPFTLVVARDAEPMHHTLDRLRWILTIGTLLTLGIGFFLIDRVVRISLRPLDRLTRQVQERTGHQLDAALDLPGELPIELSGLARSFDSLLARLATTRQREKDFIRHAAHELRTPIAGLRAITDLALSKPREASDYANFLATAQKTAVELGELVTRLSALARLDQSTSPASLESYPILEFLNSCLESFLPRFEEQGITIRPPQISAPIHVLADGPLLKIVLNNLLDNAVSYTLPRGYLHITLEPIGGNVEIRLANSVADMPPDLDRLFEPLFRREASRHDAASHLGIGLNLSQNAARAMGGILSARKKSEQEIEFVLTLPAA